MAVSIVVDDFRVRSLDVDFKELTWTLRPNTEDIFDYTFQVLRSEGPEGPFIAISQEMTDEYLYVDNEVLKGHEYRAYYYKIRVVEVSTKEVKEFGPVHHTPDPDLIATELRKHMNLLFREFVGRRCWVLPVRTFGARCTQCWDKTLKKKTKSGCLTCYDTGFAGGYLRPIESWVSVDPSPKTEQQSAVGPQQQKNTTARMGFWPPLKPNDIIVEPENKRWRVVSITHTEQLRAPVHQELQLHKIPSSDIEYRYELNFGAALKDLWLLPARQTSNPHNLEAFTDEEFPDVMQLYGSTYPPVRT